MSRKNILVIDDEQFIRMTLKGIFEKDYDVYLVDNGQKALQAIEEQEIDLAFLDMNLPDMHGIEVLKKIKAANPEIMVIVATGFATVDTAIESLKLGAYDYIKKPFRADAIKLITRLALEAQTLKQTVARLKEKQSAKFSLEGMIGVSTGIEQIKHQIEEFARAEGSTVLITGESGSGKELIAQGLHALSDRAENDFVDLNCASIPEKLLESELFGHEKGAFTDARERKIGLVERADGGTLFLDEIGEMSLPLQATLLRVIETKNFRRLGSTKDIQVDVRIIAATNRNLLEAIELKEFREDLYYRLNVLRINALALRERPEDIPLLADYFLRLFNAKLNLRIERFSEDAFEILSKYRWPGNVRELRNMVERICILHKEPVIEAHHLPEELLESTPITTVEDQPVTAEDEYAFDEIVRATEIRLLEKAYLESGRNSSKAARMLRIPRETFRYKFAKYKLGDG